MEIVRIFDNHLFSFQIDEHINEYERLFDLWEDIEFLETFFETNKNDLNRPIWRNISVEDAIEKTVMEAQLLETKISELSVINQGLESLFFPLFDSQIRPIELNLSKVRQSWIRLYALRIEPNAYIITGGAIKLTKTMQEREHTRLELIKINRSREYLLNQGIVDMGGIIDAFEL